MASVGTLGCASPDALRCCPFLVTEWEDSHHGRPSLRLNAVATYFGPLAEVGDSSDDEDDGSGLEDSFVRHTNRCECFRVSRLFLSCQCPCGIRLRFQTSTYILILYSLRRKHLTDDEDDGGLISEDLFYACNCRFPQVAPGVVNVLADTVRDFNIYIHTYIQAEQCHACKQRSVVRLPSPMPMPLGAFLHEVHECSWKDVGSDRDAA
jgi:hypothetical protein